MFEIYDPYLVNNVKYLVKPINFCQQQSVITKTKICVYFRKKKNSIPSSNIKTNSEQAEDYYHTTFLKAT